ncbi:MAG: UDP-N-acetyl-D-glucosamine dehydrogenase, partial [Candidatus Omnitrophica bacterium]|nr:UDP-N-acetyl-D-glucosamine dehydrogenase [Candidatus Omnitrophota bacterium]
DSFFPYLNIDDINLKCVKLDKKTLSKVDCVILITDHTAVNYDLVRRNSRLIFDTRHVYKENFANIRTL